MAKTRTKRAAWRIHAKAERARLYAELKENQRRCEQLEGDAAHLRGQLDKIQLRYRSTYAAVVEIGGKLELLDWLEMKEDGDG